MALIMNLFLFLFGYFTGILNQRDTMGAGPREMMFVLKEYGPGMKLIHMLKHTKHPKQLKRSMLIALICTVLQYLLPLQKHLFCPIPWKRSPQMPLPEISLSQKSCFPKKL